MGSRGVRVRVGRRSRRSDAAGCGVLVAGAFALVVVLAILRVVVQLFSTPYPWIVLGAGGLAYGAVKLAARLERERTERAYLEAVAELAGVPGATRGAVERIARMTDEADAQILTAAWLAQQGRPGDAVAAINQATAVAATAGRLGSVAVGFPALPERMWFITGHAVEANLFLAGNHLRTLAGRAGDAIRALEQRLHEPHYANALAAVVDAHIQTGNTPRAIALLQHGCAQVADPEVSRALRYRLGTLLQENGAPTSAAAQLRSVVVDGAYQDAAQRLERIDRDLAAARARDQEARDERIFADAVLELRAARGPKSRDNALEKARAELTLRHMRERLLLEASRIEVEAVLDKVATLKTKAAKVRNLEEALARIRADDVPDPLQAAEVAALENALYGLR